MAPRPYSIARPLSFAVGPTIQEGVEDVDIVPTHEEEDEEEDGLNELAGSSSVEAARLALEGGSPATSPAANKNRYIGSGPRKPSSTSHSRQASVAAEPASPASARRRTRLISMDIDPLNTSPANRNSAAPTSPVRDRMASTDVSEPTSPTARLSAAPTSTRRSRMVSRDIDPSTALSSNPARTSVAPSMASVSIDPSTALSSNPTRASLAPSMVSMDIDPSTALSSNPARLPSVAQTRSAAPSRLPSVAASVISVASVDIDPARWPATPTTPRRPRPISELVDPLTPPARSPHRPLSIHEDSAPTTPTTSTGGSRTRPISEAIDPLTPPPRAFSRTTSTENVQLRTPLSTRRGRPISEAIDPLTPPSNRGARPISEALDPLTPPPTRRARPISEAVDPLTPPSGGGRSRPISEALDPMTPSGNRMESIDSPEPIRGSRNTSFAPNNRHSTVNNRGGSVAQGDEIRRRQSSVNFAGQQRPSISVQNVVIPAHLIKHVETSWNQDKIHNRRLAGVKREDTRKSFNIEQLALDQQEEIKTILGATGRSNSISLGAMNQPGNRSSFAGNRMSYAGNRMSYAASTVSRPTSVLGSKRISFLDSNEKGDEIENKRFSGSSAAPSGGNKRYSTASVGNKRLSTASGPNKRWSANIFGGFTFGGTDAVDYGAGAGNTGAGEQQGSRLSWMPNTGDQPEINTERRPTIFQRSASIWQETKERVASKVRRSSLWDVYENAKKRQVQLRRSRPFQLAFEYTFYAFCLCFIYFILVGAPLWNGSIYWLYYVFRHKFNVPYSWTVVIIVAFLYAYSPLLILFEPDPPMPEDIDNMDPTKTVGVEDTALMIPCYKSAGLITQTLEAAVKIFPPSQIFVIANGNSPTPLDNTEEMCIPFGVNHVWSPVGSKIVAQFVGCYAAKGFKNVLLIDDDCVLPPNFPIVSDRMVGKVKCMGYTIKSVGPGATKGTLCQQAQDLEYKISGIQRALAGKIGSATFPHGAISLWDREFLIKTFNHHPGFSVSEDWFFGHIARQLGCRTKMCTSVFIETETPDAVFFSSGGARGGFGEMTIFKQRFLRWNFFFVNGMYYNMHYLLTSWALGWWELGAKLFVFQEIYETLLYLFTPFVLPISLIVRFQFSLELLAGTFVMYFINVLIFNEVHLRKKGERVGFMCLWVYYMPYKFILTLVNVGSCYWAIYKYATYFANRHPKIIEDDKAVNVVLQLEEADLEQSSQQGRRMTVTGIGSQVDLNIAGMPGGRRMTITSVGHRFSDAHAGFGSRHNSVAAGRQGSIAGRQGSISAPGGRKASVTMVAIPDPRRPSEGRKASETRKTSVTFGGRKISISAPIPMDPEDVEVGQAVVARPVRPNANPAWRRSYNARPKSFIAPVEEDLEEEVPDMPPADQLLARLQAIEDALAARNIETVDFAIETDETVPMVITEEDDEEGSSEDDEKKTEDSKSWV